MQDYMQVSIYAIVLACEHCKPLDGTSAGLCLSDAIECRRTGRYEGAYKRALDSLAHSVGVYHRDYFQAKGVLVQG